MDKIRRISLGCFVRKRSLPVMLESAILKYRDFIIFWNVALYLFVPADEDRQL